MIDLGFTNVPMEVVNWIVITTACLLAAMYIGFEIISAIGGTIMVIISLRCLIDGEPLVILDQNVGTFGALLLLFIGSYLAYRGTTGFLNSSRT